MEPPPGTTPAEQSGLWKSLWSYMVGPKQPAEPHTPPSTSPRSVSYIESQSPSSSLSVAQETPAPPSPKRQPQVTPPRTTFYSSWVSSLQLSLWDNIFGPQVVKAWPGVEQLEPDLQMHLARQVLSGEIGRIDQKGERVECSLHVLPEVDFVVASALFSAVYKGHQNTKFALSLLLRRSKHLRLYLQLQTIIADRMLHLVAKYCTALQRDPGNALGFLNSQAAGLATNLEGLYSALLPRIAFSDTHLYHASHGLDFVARATTAMIQTGSAVVYGMREEEVNTFIATLALFLSPEQRRRSALAADGREYVPDLVLQGLVTRKVPEEQLLHSLLPTTLVDLQTLQIKRMHPYNEYVVLRKEFRELELERLFKLSRQRTMPEFSQQSLFTPVKKAAPCILSLLTEAMRLDKQLREQHVQHAVLCLNRKAAVLVGYVETELARMRTAEDHTSMDSEAIERMRENLDLQVEEDYYVVLSIAESLSPGIYCKVERNPELLPELIQELFESF